jgi:hypothetical protein
MPITQGFINPVRIESTDGSPTYYFGDAVETADGTGSMPYIKETASQSYAVGDLVYLDSNGTIAICTNTSQKLNSQILGQAARAASGTTGAPTYVQVIRPCDVFIMNVFHGTPASSVTALTQLGVVYGIFKHTTTSNRFTVDIQNTTVEDGTTALAKVRVVGFPTGTYNGAVQAIGDTNGLVLVQFITFSIETDGGNIVRNLQWG